MNQTLKEIYARKSVRVYEDRPIGAEEKRRILEAAIQAPSAGNMGLYAIIDVTDPELKAKLAETCDNQPFIATAPLVLAFCVDYQRWFDAFCAHEENVRIPAEGDFMLAFADTMIAAQNAVVAAESMGIGSCYIGDFLENFEKQPPRFAVEDVVGENTYLSKTGEEYMDMLKKRHNLEGEAFDRWMTAFFKRKWNCDFSVEMSRSVRDMLKAWVE